MLAGSVLAFGVAFNANFYNGNMNTNNKNNTNNNHVRLVRSFVYMITFERLYQSYLNCNKRKSTKPSALQFGFAMVCENLETLRRDINERTYVHSSSSCFVTTYPCPREIFAAQFRDRVAQTFVRDEIEPYLEQILVDQTTSCRKNKGTDYALKLLKKYVTEASENGTKDAFYLKIDLSGYFASINRERMTNLMLGLVEGYYHGDYTEELFYLIPIIYMNNPAIDKIMKCPESEWLSVPERKRLDPNGDCGLAIGNITSQEGSNLNLNEFDHYCIEDLGLPMFVRYVDDIVIVHESREILINSFQPIVNKLENCGHKVSPRKTRIDTVYHGVKFLGRVTYPYGYQKQAKESAGRLMERAEKLKIDKNLLSKLNSQAGRLRGYACHNLLNDYLDALPPEVWEYVYYDFESRKFRMLKKEKI